MSSVHGQAADRRTIVLGVMAAVAMGMLMRAVYLQIVHKDFLQKEGGDRYLRTMEVPAHRGMIVDRNGQPLAVSSPMDAVWAHPGKLLEHRNRLPELARLLNMKTADLERRLSRGAERQFVYLRRQLQPNLAQRVMALQIPGVHLRREYRRYYSTAEVSAHLLGFTNIDDQGQEGLELTFDDWLHGVPGLKRVLKDRDGRIVEDLGIVREPQPGNKITLSIDQRIQYLAYRALKAAAVKHRASSASAVVLDVHSGEVLAMVNQPSANPNDRRARRNGLMRNRAVTDVYEPGSTLKPFTIAVALESKAYSPHTLVNTSPGRLKIGRYVIRDIRNYGTIDVSHVISKSSNVGASKIALSMPPERLWQTYTGLGFGTQTGLGFSGERSGSLRHFSSWKKVGHATHAYGYGVSMTTLQLAQAYAVLAADGVRRPLSLLHRTQPPEQQERLFSARTARQVRAMLEMAVSAKGTGARAAVVGYRVAGKTGTVHKAINGKYARRRYLSLFAGMAPATRPRLVMVVMIDEPKGRDYYGGRVAAPVFGRVMSDALRLLQVPPDAMPASNMAVALAPQGKRQ